MLDIAFIQKNTDLVRKALRDKNVQLDIDAVLELDAQRRALLQELGEVQRMRNENTALVQKAGGKRDPECIEKGKKMKERIASIESRLEGVEEKYGALMRMVPNVSSDDTPVGPDASGNVVLKHVGAIPKFSFKPREHWEIGEALGVLDIVRAGKVSGSRFSYLKGDLARLEFALVQYCCDTVSDRKVLEKIIKKNALKVSAKPFVPVVPPVLIRPKVLDRMARLEPRDERYHISSDDMYLVGSAEHTLGPLYMDEILSEQDMPLRFIGFSTAFRREAGSYGKDVKGIMRVHQFDKLEFESFTVPEQGLDEQNFIVAVQEHMMQELKLPYQVVAICTGDMGAPDYRQIDIETWMPGQNRYRETHTSDYMTDYQSRRLQTRIRRLDGSLVYAHMNDATAFAVGRTLIAIMENYQDNDGSILIPKALQRYLQRKTKITGVSVS